MALFENFPYTNLHDLNLDWVLATVRKLIAEWVAYKEAMNNNFADLSDKFDELKQYVEDYFANLDLDDAVKEAVEATLAEMIADGTMEELISEYIRNIGGSGKSVVNLLAEYLTDTLQNSQNWFSSEHYEHAPQGMCYIGNNQVVLYVLTKPNSENMGVLVCIDMASGTVLWKSNRIKAYHGNTIAYKDGYFYIAGAVDESSGTAVNHQIFKVSMNTPSSISRSFTVAGQNVAIDDVTGKFYVGGGQLGNNPNELYIYDDEFVSEPKLVYLETNALTSYLFTRSETQGICVHDGTLYELFSRECSICCAFNAETGAFIRAWNVPYVWNGCKYSQELEDISYDAENDRFLIMTSTVTQRTHNCQVANIGEIGLYKQVAERLPRFAVYEASNNANDVVAVRIENDAPQVQESGACLPFYDRHPMNGETVVANACVFYNAYDAELFASMRGNTSYIHYVAQARHTGRPVFSNWHAHTNYKLSAASNNLLRVTAPDFRRVDSAYITGSGSDGLVNIYGANSDGSILEVTDNTKLILENVEFEPNTDAQYEVVRGYDVFRAGTVRMLQTVKMASGFEALELYRVRTYGVIDNCVKVFDGAVARGQTYNFDFPVWSTGLITIETFIKGQDHHAMLVVDREGGKSATGLNIPSSPLKMFIPVDGDYYIANINISQTAFGFYALKKASDGTNVDGFDRVIIKQYPNVSYFSKKYL